MSLDFEAIASSGNDLGLIGSLVNRESGHCLLQGVAILWFIWLSSRFIINKVLIVAAIQFFFLASTQKPDVKDVC